jgi:hypothetical protein
MTTGGRNSGASGDVILRQRFSKQLSAATDTQATIEAFLGTMFPIRSVQSGYKEELS